MKLRIPPSEQENVSLLLTLDDVQTQALIRALDTVLVGSASEFAAKVTVPNVDPEGLSKIYRALRALYAVRAKENAELPEFVDAVIDAMRDTGDPRLAITKESLDSVKSRLTKLLSASAFSTSSKALDLGDEAQRLYSGVRVLTDLRPVFKDSVSEPPPCFIVVHTLKLEYHIFDYKHEDIYIAVSEDDLHEIRDAIDRAFQKSETLQAKLREAGITYIQPSKSTQQ